MAWIPKTRSASRRAFAGLGWESKQVKHSNHVQKDARLMQVLSFNGWGVSLVDGLDTMWIMGLHTEFLDSIPIVANMTFALDQVSISQISHTDDFDADP